VTPVAGSFHSSRRGRDPVEPPAPGAAPVLAALSETGAIGSTLRQLADRVQASVDTVEDCLGQLERQGTVVRMGRGLWILRSFEVLADRDDFVDPAEYTERFERDFGVALGRYDGPITFSTNEALPVHRWWPYVQGYSAEFVDDLLQRSDLSRGSTVLDPFAGSGTTLVAARQRGLAALGTELLPPAVLAARVKTAFELSPATLRQEAARFLARARRRAPGPPPFLRETARQFAPEVLDELTRLRDALPEPATEAARAVRLAFGRILIPVSRLRRSPCLGYRPADDRPGPLPFPAFEAALDEMAVDLEGVRVHRRRWGPRARVWERDARAVRLPPGSVDLAVTSPPYVNGMDYVMNYKLDLAWLGFTRSYADLRRLKTAMVACDNLPRGAVDRYRSVHEAPDRWLPPILRQIRDNVARKGSYRRDDMHAIVHRYFTDLVPVLTAVHRALAPGGRFVLVVGDSLLAGTYVPGDLLLARLGSTAGFRVAGVEVARSRRSGQRRSFRLRESIVTLEKPRAA
jgi:DNA methylase